MTIHDTHPFPTEDDPVRRFRARLGGVVTIWTTGAGEDRAGLTVSSVMVAGGAPGRVLGLLDPSSDLAEALVPGSTLVVALLKWPQRNLSEMFAGTAPAPGGIFAASDFTDTAWGPLLTDATTWAGARVERVAEVGWSVLVEAAIEEIVIGDETEPLVHRRGRYQRGGA